jgi:hypothetical protein
MQFEQAPLASIFGEVFTDDEGKIVAEAPAAELGDENEERIRSIIARN